MMMMIIIVIIINALIPLSVFVILSPWP